jgi:endoglucanase
MKLPADLFSSLDLRAWTVAVAFTIVGCSQGTAERTESGQPVDVSEGTPATPAGPTTSWTAPAAPPVGSPVATWGQLAVSDVHLVSATGQNVQLKGVSSMWLNWESRAFAENKDGMGWMRDNWNLSLMRAAMGVEPSGAYLSNPSAAMNKVRTIVHNAIDQGVYVLIDWHDHHAQLHPSDAVTFFDTMSKEFGSFPNVIYEPFNEPNCATQVDNCSADERLAWPELKQYHEQVVAAIRANDPDNVIVLGTPSWSQEVDQAAANPLSGSNLMYTLHFYSCSHTAWLRDRAQQALQDGLPIFVTEWGATDADGGTDGLLCLDEAQAWHDWMNSNSVSWAAWKFDSCKDSTCFFNSNVSLSGGWTDAELTGHGPFVRDRMLEMPAAAAAASTGP